MEETSLKNALFTLHTRQELDDFLASLPDGMQVSHDPVDVRRGNFDHCLFLYPTGQRQHVYYEGDGISTPYTKDFLLTLLEDGHALIDVRDAQELCAVFGVEFTASLVMEWASPRIAYEKYNLVSVSRPVGSGVSLLELGYWMCQQLGLKTKPYNGKGFQAREHVRVLREHFQVPELYVL